MEEDATRLFDHDFVEELTEGDTADESGMQTTT